MRPARADPKQSHNGVSHATQLIELIVATPAVAAGCGGGSRSKPSALPQKGADGELDALAPELACG
jgi:hypothetical protein